MSTRLASKDGDLNLTAQFANLSVILPDGGKFQLLNENGLIPGLTEQEIQEISTGLALIKPVFGSETGDSQLWIAINVVENRPEAGILMGELKPELIWEAENVEPNDLWVLTEGNQILFATGQGFELPADVKTQLSHTNTGQFTWVYRGSAYVGNFRKLPRKAVFNSPEIVIVQAQPEALAFAAIQQFGTIYPPVIALAVLIVAFFITRLIIKYLSPLEQLKAATLKIADGDFNSHVSINSNDEFEALADSFNEMTRRLRSQFDILSTMAEIDRHILSALDADEIVETALKPFPWRAFLRFDRYRQD